MVDLQLPVQVSLIYIDPHWVYWFYTCRPKYTQVIGGTTKLGTWRAGRWSEMVEVNLKHIEALEFPLKQQTLRVRSPKRLFWSTYFTVVKKCYQLVKSSHKKKYGMTDDGISLKWDIHRRFDHSTTAAAKIQELCCGECLPHGLQHRLWGTQVNPRSFIRD